MIPYETPETTGKVKPSIPLVLPKQTVPDSVAQVQSEKMAYAIGGGQEEIYSRLVNGQEEGLRSKVAADKTLELQKEKGRWLSEIARLQEGPLSQDQFSFIQGLTQDQVVDPKTVFESEYAQKMFKDLFYTSPEEDSLVDRASVENPVKTDTLHDIGTEIIAKQEIAKRRHDEGRASIKKSPWLTTEKESGYLDNLLEQLVPFKSWTNLSVETKGIAGSSWLKGADMADQVRNLVALPLPEFTRLFNAAYDDIYKTNPLDAQTFAEAVSSFSSSDELWGNVDSLLDIASVPGTGYAGKLIGRGARVLGEVSDFGKAVKAVTRVNNGKTNVVSALTAAGKTEDAAVVQTLKNVKTESVATSLVAKDPLKQLETVLSRTISFMDPHAYLSGSKMSREYLQRLETGLIRTSGSANKGLVNRATLARLTEEQTAVALRENAANFRKEYPHTNNTVMDLIRIPAETSPTNVDTVVYRLSRPSGEPFQSKVAAGAWAKNTLKLSKGTYTIEQLGDGHYIQVLRNLDETTDMVRDALLTTGNETPVSSVNTMLGRARSAEDLLPEENLASRKRLVHGMQELFRIHNDIVAPIRSMSNRSKERFERFTTMLRDMARKEEAGARRGQFFKTQGEFETAWQDAFGKLPTVQESHAYFAYLSFYDLDYALKNFSIYAGKAREGLSQFRLSGLEKEMPFIEGKFISDFNIENLTDKANILIYSSDGELTVLKKSDAPKELFEGLSQNGYRAFQVGNWHTRPLQEATGVDEYINFVYTKSFENKALTVEQIPYNPGGHVVYDYNYKIAQPRINPAKGRKLYSNDTTLRFGRTEKEAKQAAALYEEARQLYLKSIESKSPNVWVPARKEFKDFVEKNLPEKPSELRRAFEDGSLGKNERITWTRMGYRTIDDPSLRESLGAFEDVTRDPLTLGQDINKEFTGERGFNLSGLRSGEDGEPLFALEAPRLLDPLSTVQRAAESMARSSFFEDYRRLSAERFATEFKDVLSMPPERLRQNPIAALYDPKWNEKALDRNRLQAAKNYQKAVIDLMNVRTPTEKNLLWLKEKLYNSLFDSLGQKTADFLDDRLLAKIADPVVLARSAVFHLKLGLLNPRQLFQQAQTLTHVMSLVKNPVIAEKAMVGYQMRFLGLSQESDKIIDHFAGIAGKLGWNKEQFKEAYDFLKRSGVMNVEGEQVLRDNLASPTLFRGKLGSWFDKGNLFFFREGEKMNRLVAFNAAYLEWRAENPAGKLTRQAEMSILRRQDTMTVNMTRASSASWQKGFLSVPTQFFSYQTRLWEQMAGKRLTSSEKARVMLTYAAMYGVPVGIGGTLLPIYPWYEDIREARLKSGQAADDVVIDSLHYGLVSTMMKMIGFGDYAFGEGEGPRGLPTSKIFDGQFLEVLLGAVGTTGAEGVGSLWPIIADVQTVLSEGPKAENLRITAQDLGDATRIISTVNSGYKLYYALNYGKAITRGEIPIDEVTPVEGVMMSVFGINPNRFEDMYAMMRDTKDLKGAKGAAEKQIVKYLRRGFKEKDEEQRLQYFKQAEVWRQLGDIRPDRFGPIFSEAAKGYENLLDDINRSYFLDALPQSQREQGLKNYQQMNKE